MPIDSIGTFIKNLRLEHGWTLEQLAEATDRDPGTLSRIERNRNAPSPLVFDNIMSKFGLDPHSSYDMWILSREYKMYVITQKLKELLFLKKYDEAEETLKEYEAKKKSRSGPHLQFVLYVKICIMDARQEDPNMIRTMIFDALHITLPAFEVKNVKSYYISYIEISLIHLLSVQYAELNNIEQAARILFDLKTNMDARIVDEDEKMKTYPAIFNDLTRNLCQLKRYQEVIELCRYICDLCIKRDKLFLYPDILTNYACALYYTGDFNRCKEYLTQAYLFLKIIKRSEEAGQLKINVKKDYGIEL